MAHNLADSLGSGCSLLTGVYECDLFKELANTGDRAITIDLLTGELTADAPSTDLVEMAARAPRALGDLCSRQNASLSDFVAAFARFWLDDLGQQRFDVTVEDIRGRRTTQEYRGWPGKRLNILDGLGRRRPKPALIGHISS